MGVGEKNGRRTAVPNRGRVISLRGNGTGLGVGLSRFP